MDNRLEILDFYFSVLHACRGAAQGWSIWGWIGCCALDFYGFKFSNFDVPRDGVRVE